MVDLTRRFGMPQHEATPNSCIIVLRSSSGRGERLIGAIADGVSEVLSIPETDVEESPDFGNDVQMPYLLGIAKSRGKVKLLLDVEQIFLSSTIRTAEQDA